jgi:hypothetical protein
MNTKRYILEIDRLTYHPGEANEDATRGRSVYRGPITHVDGELQVSVFNYQYFSDEMKAHACGPSAARKV